MNARLGRVFLWSIPYLAAGPLLLLTMVFPPVQSEDPISVFKFTQSRAAVYKPYSNQAPAVATSTHARKPEGVPVDFRRLISEWVLIVLGGVVLDLSIRFNLKRRARGFEKGG